MVWPVSKADIERAERELNVTFPAVFAQQMSVANGGSVELLHHWWELCTFEDRSSNKRLTRTFDGIVRETRSMRELAWFPQTGVVIGTCNSDRLILLPESAGSERLADDVFVWRLDSDESPRRVCSLDELFANRHSPLCGDPRSPGWDEGATRDHEIVSAPTKSEKRPPSPHTGRGRRPLWSGRGRVALLTVALLALAVAVWRASVVPLWPAREALPADVRVIDEDIYEDEFLGEFNYTLRVRITPDQFEEWMLRLELPARDDGPEYSEQSRAERDRIDAEQRGCHAMATLVRGVGTLNSTCW